jgi:CelD/BcsL family acetyltransferase involved in cellulose biosynthesis
MTPESGICLESQPRPQGDDARQASLSRTVLHPAQPGSAGLSQPPLAITRYTDWSTIAPLAPAWTRLRLMQPEATVFAGYGFTRALWKCFASDARMELLAIEDSSGIVGLAPLVRTRIGPVCMRYAQIGFFRNHHTLRNTVLTAPGQQQAVLSAMMASLARTTNWQVMFLENVPEEKTLLSALTAAVSEQRLRRDEFEAGRRLCFLPIERSWSEYRAAMSKSFRWQLKKFERRARELGKVEFRCLSTRSEIAAALPEVFKLQAKSWQGRERSDEDATAADQAFDYALLEDLSDDEVGDLWLMTIDERLIASLRMLGDVRKRYVHTMHYDPAAKDVAPGVLLFERMLEAAWAAHLAEVDCHGDSSFFRRWTSQHRKHVTTRVYSASNFGRLLQIGRQVRHQWRLAVARDADQE